MDTKFIERKSAKVNIRGNEYEIVSMSIDEVEKLKKCLNVLVLNFFKQASALPKLQMGTNGVPIQTKVFLSGVIDTITSDILNLLQVSSGLPEKFFQNRIKRSWKERFHSAFWLARRRNPDCLTVSEMEAIGEVVFEVNGLSFFLEALKKWWEEKAETFSPSSVPSASSTPDTPLSE